MGHQRFPWGAMLFLLWGVCLVGQAWAQAAPDGDNAPHDAENNVQTDTISDKAETLSDEPLLFPPPALLLKNISFAPVIRDQDLPTLAKHCRDRDKSCLSHLLFLEKAQTDPEKKRALGFQAARLAYELSENNTAKSLFERLRPQAGILSDTVDYYLAMLAYRAEDFEQTLAFCAKIPSTSRRYGHCRQRRAQSLLRLNKLDEARTALEMLRDEPLPGVYKNTITWKLADCLWQQKQRSKAKPLLRSLWRDNPLGTYESKVEERLNRFAAPRYGTLVEDRLSRAQALHKRYRYRQAQKELDKAQEILDDQQDRRSRLAGRVKLWQGLTKFRYRHYSDAIDLFTEALSCNLSKDDKATARFFTLDAYSRKSLYKKVHAKADAFLARHSDHEHACMALYLDATAYRSEEKTTLAVRRYREVAKRFPTCNVADDSLWFAAWALYRKGRLDDAMKALDEMARAFPDSFNEQQATYWLGRCYQDKKDTRQAVVRYRDVWRRWPLSYYGMLSLWRLKELKQPWPEGVWPKENLKDLPLEVDLDLEVSYLAANRHVRKGLELLRLGLKSDAAGEFSAIDRDSLDEADQIKLDWLLTVVYHRAGDLYRSHFIPRLRRNEFMNDLPTKPRRSFWKLAYPYAYGDLLSKYGKKFKIDPLFVMSIMREESGFHPQIESPANAVGLTQIINSTGRRIARQLGVRGFRHGDLKDPETAIRFGAFHLKELLDRWDGKYPLAIGSYNAGAGAVARWVNQNGDLLFDVWLEEIPYRETRNYTRRVLKTYGIYRYLYTDTQIGPDLPQKANSKKSLRLKPPKQTSSSSTSTDSASPKDVSTDETPSSKKEG